MRRIKAVLACLAVVLFILGVNRHSIAGPVFDVATIANQFGTLDVSTGQFTQIATLSIGDNVIVGMGFAPGGNLYAIGGNPFGDPTRLYQIDPRTGATTVLGTIDHNSFGAGADRNGILYSLDQSSSALLYTVSPPSPATTPIGTVGFTADGLVAVDAKGNLFATNSEPVNDVLYQIDPTTAVATPLGTGTGFNAVFSGALAGDTLSGFTADIPGFSPASQIITIDTTTGAGTLVGTYALPEFDFIVAAVSQFCVL